MNLQNIIKLTISFLFLFLNCEMNNKEDILYNAITQNDFKTVKKIILKGADPFKENTDSIVPFYASAKNTINGKLYKPYGASDSIFLFLMKYNRLQKGTKLTFKGKVSNLLEQVGFMQFVNHLVIDNSNEQYNLNIGSFETKLIGVNVTNNRFHMKPGGYYRVSGTLNKNDFEADTLEYLEGGKGDYIFAGGNYLPSTKNILDSLYYADKLLDFINSGEWIGKKKK